MKRHPFDPISLILGLACGALGLAFLFGDPDVAEIGWKWMWPFPVIMLGLLFVVSAGRRMLPTRAEPELEHDPAGDAEDVATGGDD